MQASQRHRVLLEEVKQLRKASTDCEKGSSTGTTHNPAHCSEGQGSGIPPTAENQGSEASLLAA